MTTRSPHLLSPLQNGGRVYGLAMHKDPRFFGTKFVCKNEKKITFNIDINFVRTILPLRDKANTGRKHDFLLILGRLVDIWH